MDFFVKCHLKLHIDIDTDIKLTQIESSLELS